MSRHQSRLKWPEEDTYLVLNDFGGSFGYSWRNIYAHRADRERLIRDLVDGQFDHPVRIVAFTTEGWSRDVTIYIADNSSKPIGAEETRDSAEFVLLGQSDFPDGCFGKRHGIGNAAFVNADHSLGDDLANRIVTIHQVHFPDGAGER